NQAWPILRPLLDGFCMHAYTGITGNVGQAINDIVSQVKELQAYLNLQVPLIVSECSVNRYIAGGDGLIDRDATDRFRAAVYRGVDTALGQVPGVEACVYYISYWSETQDINKESWLNTSLPTYYKNG
ncbi:MAG: hypothetical protein D6706_22010, partial [Chloroflexi bacterium]